MLSKCKVWPANSPIWFMLLNFLVMELPHTASYLEIIGVIFGSRSFWVLLRWFVPKLLLLLAPQPSAVLFHF